ncbi:MAG: Flp family type IVb pilin [Devosia sp.]|nr:Flp family type IVb pilin [Devosia sp.]
MASLGSMIAGCAADEKGAATIEYGLIAVLIALALTVALNNFGGGVTGLFDYVINTAGAAIADAGN